MFTLNELQEVALSTDATHKSMADPDTAGSAINLTRGERDVKKMITFGMLSCLLLTGCSMVDRNRDPALASMTGLQFENNGQREYLKHYTKNTEGTFNADRIKLCAIRSISNDDIVLNGSSSVMKSVMSKSFYVQNSNMARGGAVVDNGASTADNLVANGTTSYPVSSFGLRNEFAVKFTVDISGTDSGLQYVFSKVSQAKKNTGALSNSGFHPVGVWVRENPGQVIQSLNKIIDDINHCLSS